MPYRLVSSRLHVAVEANDAQTLRGRWWFRVVPPIAAGYRGSLATKNRSSERSAPSTTTSSGPLCNGTLVRLSAFVEDAAAAHDRGVQGSRFA